MTATEVVYCACHYVFCERSLSSQRVTSRGAVTEGDRVVDVAVALPFFGDLAVGFFVVRDVEVVVDVVYRLLLRSFCHRRRGCSLP